MRSLLTGRHRLIKAPRSLQLVTLIIIIRNNERKPLVRITIFLFSQKHSQPRNEGNGHKNVVVHQKTKVSNNDNNNKNK